MLDILKKIYALILPPHTSSVVVQTETIETFQRVYEPQKTSLGTTLTSYRNPIVQAAITANKFHGDVHASRLLAALLAMYIERFSNTILIIVPIPLSSTRQHARGYNQVTQIISQIPENRNQTVYTYPVLLRPYNTPPQTSLNRADRLKNVQAAFTVDPAWLEKIPTAAHIIIVDDVTTTGATLKAAANTLRGHLTSTQTLECVALAH